MTQNCGKCDKVFVTKTALEEHMLSHEDFQKVKRRGRPGSRLPCGDCNEIFYRRCDLRLHRRMTHQYKKNACEVCGRAFSNERRLKMHYQFHNVGGEYECYYCSKGFNKGWKMKIHLVNHSGRSPYVCQYCEEDFLYPGKIIEHLKREHDVLLACKDCGAGFRNIVEQDDHTCKIYGCKDCSASFGTVKELASHSELHSMNYENPSVDEVHSQICSVSDALSAAESLNSCLSVYEVSLSRCPPSNDFEVPSCLPSDEVNSLGNEKKDPSIIESSNIGVNFFSMGLSKHASDIPELLTDEIPSKENINGESKTSIVTDISKDIIVENVKVSYAYDHESGMGLSVVNSTSNLSVTSNTQAVSDCISSFKVPRTKWNPLKRPINILRKKPVHLDQGLKSNNIGMVKEWKFNIDKNSLVKEQVSLKSWLISDSSTCVADDFVFGMESKEPKILIDSTKNAGIKDIKEEGGDMTFEDMTFEDLCQF